MRAMFALAALIVAAACGETSSPPPASAPARAEAEAPAPPALTGQFIAVSTTAMSLTGDIDVQPDVLSFAKGFRLEGGRIDAMLAADTDLSAGGGTIADSSGVPNSDTIELRRIDNVRVAADARDPDLCASKPVSHAILAKNETTLSVLVFSGVDAPGPNAHDTQLCGVFNYAVG